MPNSAESRCTRAERAMTSLGVFLWEAKPADGFLRVDEGACRLLGIDSSIGQASVSALYLRAHVEDGPGLFEAFDAATRDGRGFTLRRRFTQTDGSIRWWEISGEVVKGSSAEDRVIAGWLREVHEEQSRAERYEKLDGDMIHRHRLATIEGFADGVAHEFKNVLQIIRGYVSFAKKALPDSSGPSVDLEQALVATDRASDVAHQLLAYSRCEDDELEVSDVNELLTDAARFLRPILGIDIEMTVAVSVDPLATAGLEASVRQMLVNLCLNARNAMPSGGQLLLRAERFSTTTHRADIGGGLEPGDYARIFFTDGGHGVAPEDLQRLFEPYYTTKSSDEGTGLGLSVVKQLAENGGGAVTAYSEEGVGSTFTLYVPLEASDLQEHRDPPSDLIGDLLVLGEGAVRSTGSLVDAGWHIHNLDPAEDLADFERTITDCQAVLVSSDCCPETLAELRRLAASAPFLSLTRFDPQSTIASKPAPGFDAVIGDPVDTDRLVSIIGRLRRESGRRACGEGLGQGSRDQNLSHAASNLAGAVK